MGSVHVAVRQRGRSGTTEEELLKCVTKMAWTISVLRREEGLESPHRS